MPDDGEIRESDGDERRIGVPLMIGLLALPLVFGWFLLRPGYANSTRIVVAIYALMGPAFVLLGGGLVDRGSF